MEKYYTIGGLHVSRIADIWTLPALVGNGVERSAGTIVIRIAEDGIACHPYTDGLGSSQRDDNVYLIEADMGLRGWGKLDCEKSYRVAGGDVPAVVLEQVAEWTGLRLPSTAE